MIMRTIIAGLLIATISHPSRAQTVQRIEIVEYGLYSVDVTAKKDDPGSATGERATVANIRHVETTTTIPARGLNLVFVTKSMGDRMAPEYN
jgi:hypothetical protein